MFAFTRLLLELGIIVNATIAHTGTYDDVSLEKANFSSQCRRIWSVYADLAKVVSSSVASLLIHGRWSITLMSKRQLSHSQKLYDNACATGRKPDGLHAMLHYCIYMTQGFSMKLSVLIREYDNPIASTFASLCE